MAIDVLTPMDNNNNKEKIFISKRENGRSFSESNKLSPFEKLSDDLRNDERVAKEIAIGKRIGFYRIRGNIGSGNFSQVKLGYHCLAKEKVAVKILDKTKLDKKTQRLLSREISSMEELKHPNIIRIYEVLETLTKVHIFMEYAPGGELFHKILNEGKLTEVKAKLYFSQILSAVDHMHKNNIIHRDLKAENVFISPYETVKVGDFGFSTVSSTDEVLNTFCGSPPYAAPELFRDENYVGVYVDIWALGIMLYFMVTGTMPFRAETVGKLKKRILEGGFDVPDYVSDLCSNLIRAILKPVPTERLKISEIFTSRWLRGVIYPELLPEYSAKPQLNLDECLQADELEANKCIRNLGVSTQQIRKLSHDSRNCVTGTYRIILHQVQRRSYEEKMEEIEAAKRKNSAEKQAKKKRLKGDKNNNVKSSNPKSKLCIIL